jgi:UDP-N-acetylmuramoyl-tripeptide--D-alanyl-D-alanine ligase
VPSDEPLLAPHLPGADGPDVITFGPDEGADVRVLHVAQDRRTRARLTTREHGMFEIELRVFGVHNARNAAAALAVGLRVGLPLPSMIDALAQFEPVGDRGRTLELGQHLVVADCYNANPGSVVSALRSLSALPAPRRRFAVLGDMLELGPSELDLHAEIGRLCGELGLDGLAAIGPRSRATARAAADAGVPVHEGDDVLAAAEWIVERAGDCAAVLVKGSRGMRLERVVDALVDRWQPLE